VPTLPYLGLHLKPPYINQIEGPSDESLLNQHPRRKLLGRLLLINGLLSTYNSATHILPLSAKMSTTTTLNSTNIAVTTNPSHELSIVEVPMPSPAAGECLIHVTATGICGSDVHFWKHGGIGSSKITCELGLGHESAGEIIGLGEGVEGWKIGTLLTNFSLSTCCEIGMVVIMGSVHKVF
jgi:hypothetical protein